MGKWAKRIVSVLIGLVMVGLVAVLALQYIQGSVLRGLTNGQLEGADYWQDEPAILSAGLGFDNIIGLPAITSDVVRGAGGSWYSSLQCTNGEEPSTGIRTSAAAVDTIGQAFKGYADYDGGLSVVFSWPVATETVDPTDFKCTLNSGATVFGHAAGMNPNWEHNERNTVVLFGDFGNRKPSADPGALFPVKLEIVADKTPLLLVGPGGREVSAVGLTWTTEKSPYDQGPVLVGAKLNHIGDQPVGEGGVFLMERAASMPNDEFALYGGGDFRLRVLTTGGFSPDGVTGLRPDMFEDFFRVHAKGADGKTVIMDKVGTDYRVAGGTLRIVGLSDLGSVKNADKGVFYDGCYQEDRDNYIDIILVGDQAAARNVTLVEIPGLKNGYRVFYNPGGPGPEPFAGVPYTAPGPRDLEPVVIALDDPMRINRDARTAAWFSWQLIAAAILLLAGILLVVIRRRSKHATPSASNSEASRKSTQSTTETRPD